MTRMTGPDCVVMCNLINTHTHTHANENRIGEGGRGTKKRKKPQNSCRHRAGNGETWVESEKNVEKKGLVQ